MMKTITRLTYNDSPLSSDLCSIGDTIEQIDEMIKQYSYYSHVDPKMNDLIKERLGHIRLTLPMKSQLTEVHFFWKRALFNYTDEESSTRSFRVINLSGKWMIYDSRFSDTRSQFVEDVASQEAASPYMKSVYGIASILSSR